MTTDRPWGSPFQQGAVGHDGGPVALGAEARESVRSGILDPAEGAEVEGRLTAIGEDVASGRVAPIPPDEDVHTFNTLNDIDLGTALALREAVLRLWIDEFEATHAWGGVTSLTLHPQVSGRPMRWYLLRDVLRHVTAKGDVWIVTGAEIARHFETCEAGAAR